MAMEHVTRRCFIRRLAVGAAAGAALIRRPWVAFPQEEAALPEARFFTPQEWAAVEAAAARIFPSNDGPGAREAEVVRYIDRALADAYPEHQQLYRQGIAELEEVSAARYGASFASLGPEQQDTLLTELAQAGFLWFALLRDHTIEGCFADPSYGGNKDGVLWEWIGYPGPVQPRGYEAGQLECP